MLLFVFHKSLVDSGSAQLPQALVESSVTLPFLAWWCVKAVSAVCAMHSSALLKCDQSSLLKL